MRPISPPLLTTSGERVDLVYDTHCAAPDEDVEPACDVRGSVFMRAAGDRMFDERVLVPRSVDGRQQLVTSRFRQLSPADPEDSSTTRSSKHPRSASASSVPAGGAEAPQASRPLENEVDVSLGRHEFGRGRRAGTRRRIRSLGRRTCGRRARARKEPRPDRCLRVRRGQRRARCSCSTRCIDGCSDGGRAPSAPARIPVSVTGTLADLATGRRRLDLRSRERRARRAEGARETLRRRRSRARGDRDGRAHVVADPDVTRWARRSRAAVASVDAGIAWTVCRRLRPSSSSVDGQARPFRDGVEVIVLRRGNELRVALLVTGGGSAGRGG